MRKHSIALTMVLMIFLIILSVSIAGCSSKAPSTSPVIQSATTYPTPNDPNAFRTAVPTTPTPVPTPTTKPVPKFSRGDIVTYEPVTAKTNLLYIILDYDSKNDGYDTTHIFRNDDGSWGHWNWLSNDYYFEREKFEKNYNAPDTWIYGHIDPDTVSCEIPKDPDAAKFFKCARK